MRLRRETGDFSIDVSNISEGPVKLPKNLSKEDFIGCIVKEGNIIEVIMKATPTPSSADITLITLDSTYRYNKESGELTEQVGPSGDLL